MTSQSQLRLQPLTRAHLARLGPPGRSWAEQLPVRLAELAQSWGLILGAALPGGSSSYVCSVRRHDGSPAVVKVSLPEEDWEREAAALRRGSGRGYARLLAVDGARQALLLEALGPSVAQSGGSPPDQLRALAATLRTAWQPPAVDDDIEDRAGNLATAVERRWRASGRSCSPRLIEAALAAADRVRRVPQQELAFVHGDAHPGNLLRVLEPRVGAESGYCFVDPDGFVTDRAYDLGVAVRDWSVRLLAHVEPRRVLQGYCQILADATGVSAARIWDWGLLERVSTGLYVQEEVGAPRLAATFLDSAERLAGSAEIVGPPRVLPDGKTPRPPH